MSGIQCTSADGVVLHHVDEHVIVAEKPSGMLVHRGEDRDPVVLMTAVRDLIGGWTWPAHRLDRGTSGAVVLARSSEAAGQMQRLFRDGLMDKRYLAWVRGVAPEGGIIDHPVPKDGRRGPRLDAVSAWRRLAISKRAGGRKHSLVEVSPKTGRRHQLRRHLSHLNHPILGDQAHGDRGVNRLLNAELGLTRMALHAWRIAYDDPWTGERVQVTVPVPEDLAGPVGAMGLLRELDTFPPWDPFAELEA